MPIGVSLNFIRQCLAHKLWVAFYLAAFCVRLLWRALVHDLSKFGPLEFSLFARTTRGFRAKFGGETYQRTIDSLGPALTHHYRCNRHHPEYWVAGVQNMSLVDLVEMLCDWKAAVRRQVDGDIVRSIAVNRVRYGLSDDLAGILLCTAFDVELVRGVRAAEAEAILATLKAEQERQIDGVR